MKKFTTINIFSISIGVVYIWFGMLKFFPSLSPAEELAINTINKLTFNLISAKISIILLAVWEVCVGLMLIFNIYRRYAIIFALAHMILTFTPFIFFPELTFTIVPYGFTIIGQYILKNIIIIGALMVLYNEEITLK